MNFDSKEGTKATSTTSRFTMYPREVHLPEVRTAMLFKSFTI